MTEYKLDDATTEFIKQENVTLGLLGHRYNNFSVSKQLKTSTQYSELGSCDGTTVRDLALS